jgi:ABC-type transport system involved in cytochrome bd biosynthesis fused ATPase/permease subunit
LECAGNVAFSAIMICVSAILIVESARDIASHKSTDVERLHLPSLIAVAASFAAKAVLAVINYRLRKQSSQVNMLWKDCRNDLFIIG